MTSTSKTERPGESGGRPLRDTIQELLYGDNPVPIALLYLAALTLAELLTVLLIVQVGVVLHLAILALLMVHTAATWGRPRHRFLMALVFVPLIRVISMSLPLVGFPLIYWYLITSIPLFVAAVVVMRLLGFPWRDLGLTAGGLPEFLLQLLIGLTGIGLGYVEYLILRPESLVATFTLQALWLPALILLVSTGYLEELIFRCIMQRTAIEELGRWPGILYVAIFFAVLHIGYNSLSDVLFVFAVGLAFGWIVYRTGSLIGVTLSHGLTNIFLFLVAPFWLADNQMPLLPLAGDPAAAEAILPATEPAVTVSVLAARTEATRSATAVTASPLGSTVAAPTATATATERPAATPVETVTPTPTATPTATPTSTATLTGTAAAGPSEGRIIEYVVQPGDYMRQLDRDYGTTVEAIQQLNGLTPDSIIQPGNHLLIPAGTTLTPTLPSGTTITYVVQPGDYLFAIAQQFNTTVDAIVDANNLEDRWRIDTGQYLQIPVGPTLNPTPETSQQTKKPRSLERGASYDLFLTEFQLSTSATLTTAIKTKLSSRGMTAIFRTRLSALPRSLSAADRISF